MRNHRICCVCLTDEPQSNFFASVFENKVATSIFNISGLQIVETADGTPSLICASCENDVKSADFVRLQVIKGQKRLAEMNAKTEVKLLQKNRKRLVKDRPSFPFFLSKTTLEKVEEWRKDQNLLESLKENEQIPIEKPKKDPEVKPELFSPIRGDSAEVEFISKEMAIKREKQPAIPVKKFTGKKEKEKQPMVVIKDLDFHQSSVPGIKKEKTKVSKPLRYKNSTKRKNLPTLFECDSCKKCYPSCEMLNKHMEEHTKLLDEETEPKRMFDSPPMIISQIHEAGDFECDPSSLDFSLEDVILIPPKEPEIINIDDDDEKAEEDDIESLLQQLY